MDPRNRTHAPWPLTRADPSGLALRILAVQVSLGAAMVPAVASMGGPAAAASAALGLLSVAFPQWLAHRSLPWAGARLPRLIALEALRVGSTLALLLYGARSIPGFVWWGAMFGLILAVKAPWFVLLRKGIRT